MPDGAVRRATVDDLPALVDRLWLPFAEEMAELDDYHALAPDAREAAVEHKRGVLGRDDAACFVAVVDGALVGLSSVEFQAAPPVFERGPSGVLHEFYVRPGHRGAGLGRRLLDAAEEWATNRGCERLTLTVDVANEDARRVYEAAGFESFRAVLRKPLTD